MKKDTVSILWRMEVVMTHAMREARHDFELACASGGARVENKVSQTSLPDYVTETDRRIEDLIREELGKTYPQIPTVGEERGGSETDEYFLVDPIDGTKNFASLRPYFGISVALIRNNRPAASVVADPMEGVMGAAAGEEDVFLVPEGKQHGMPLSVKGRRLKLREAQFDAESGLTKDHEWDLVRKILPHTAGMRKEGSSALDLLSIARGRRSVMWANNLKPYDIAGAWLIARNAGVKITTLDGRPATFRSSEIIAAAPSLHNQVMKLIKV